jgi:Ca2+-binding EF-hand superfamily protein
MTQSSPLIKDELLRAHHNFLTFKKDYSLDRCAFSLLFDSSIVPFAMIDQLFDSYDVDKSGSIDFEELALGLVASSTALETDEKLNIMFDSMDANGDEELTRDEVRDALGRFLTSAIARMRGSSSSSDLGAEDRGGKVKFLDRRCSGCKQVPVNLSYECVECRKGYALGVPITVHLCKDCVGSWEGYGANSHDMRHTLAHQMVKSVSAPNPHQVTHCGVECTGCGEMPIVGTRYRCKDCVDFVSLCPQCFEAGEEPRGHSLSHAIEVLTKAPSVEEEVMHFVDALFQLAAHDGRVTRKKFVEWGSNSEVAMALLKGLEVQHVKLAQHEESCSVEESTSHSLLGER